MQHTYMRRSLLMLFLTAVSSMSVSIAANAQSATNAAPYPPPGRLVDLGGWRLHINCAGEVTTSQPTVILEAGAGGFSVDWSLVQPHVARFARVCSYDRAGSGWSDLGPRPRTLHQIVWELHTLLEKAGVRPPYVFVGHSYGGILTRLYASTYPSDIAGIIFEDSGHESGVAFMINGKMVRAVETATGKSIPAVKTSNPLHESDIPPGPMRNQIEAAARQGGLHANDPPHDKLPADAKRMRAWSLSQIKHYAANDNPFEGEELAAMLADQKKKQYPLGDIPLVVLSRGLPEYEGTSGQIAEEEHERNQAALVGLSRRGKQVIAKHSGHHILFDEPELVVTSIRQVVGSTTRH